MFKINKRSSIFLLSVILSVLFIATGCGNNTASNSSGQNKAAGDSQASATAPAPSAEANSDVRKIKHAMGETEIKGTPERVVVLTNEGTEALLALGVKPIGAVKSWMGEPWYDHIKAQMDGVTVVGDEVQPNIELISSLKPDLIIGSKVRQEKVYQQLASIAPTVFSETFSGNWKTNFSLYAEALGKKEDGQKLLDEFDKSIASAKQKLGDKTSMKVSMVRFLPEGARIYYKNSFSGELLDQLGFNRPESQQKDKLADDVTKERIPEMDGDILFYFVWEDHAGEVKGKKTAEEWMKDPLWQNLSVAKQNKVHEVSDAIWNTSGGILSAKLMLDELVKLVEGI
ncbi:ABC transporter substrate-binding protein [Brevibacillus borstelensis]|uniref:ABC transporter substrate-binding protein n=1 Tax=Brevibacillus borstelensis TaxID=45462 RepID=UPI0030BC0A74